jgi:dihydropteroate synthase
MAKDTFLNRKTTLNLNGRLFDLTNPQVMAILNITPDSFYHLSRTHSVEEALIKTESFLKAGATIIDIGAYSSRPGAAEVSEAEEINRIVPIIRAISKSFPEAAISIDTFRAAVARAGIGAGAHIVNDISGGELDENMFATVAELDVPYILMHMKGTPQNMHIKPHYEDVVLELVDYFSQKIAKLRALGVKDIILDPGFGFAKNKDHSYELLNHLEDFKIFGLSLIVGFSRKSMIHGFLNISPDDALNGTTVLNTIALQKGASILRVHDVTPALECIKLVARTQQR